MKKTVVSVLIFFLLILGSSASTQAVTAITAGPDNFTTTDFYSVGFFSGSGFIQSVSFDLTADPDAFFDFDGGASFADQTAPVLGAMSGLIPGDLGWVFGSPVGQADHPAVLTFNFAPGSFGVGDFFNFSADTDFFFSDPAPGGVLGLGGAIFSVVFENGQTGSAPFITLRPDLSIADISVCPIPVPIPAAVWLLGSGLLGLAALRRK